MKLPMTCRILYAEDNEDCRTMMKFLLEFAGIEAVTTHSVAEAWSMAQSEKFDLYLLDVRLSDGDGLELCRRLRLYDPHTPIFIYSGKAFETDRANGLTAGADEYLIKPNLDNIQEKILQAVKFSGKNKKIPGAGINILQSGIN